MPAVNAAGKGTHGSLARSGDIDDTGSRIQRLPERLCRPSRDSTRPLTSGPAPPFTPSRQAVAQPQGLGRSEHDALAELLAVLVCPLGQSIRSRQSGSTSVAGAVSTGSTLSLLAVAPITRVASAEAGFWTGLSLGLNHRCRMGHEIGPQSGGTSNATRRRYEQGSAWCLRARDRPSHRTLVGELPAVMANAGDGSLVVSGNAGRVRRRRLVELQPRSAWPLPCEKRHGFRSRVEKAAQRIGECAVYAFGLSVGRTRISIVMPLFTEQTTCCVVCDKKASFPPTYCVPGLR